VQPSPQDGLLTSEKLSATFAPRMVDGK